MVLSIECPNCGCNASALAMSCPCCGFPVVLYASMTGRAEASDGDPLELVAMNPHTPPVMLEMLCENDNECVRSALTRNPSTPEALLFQLSNDFDEDVRIALASSPHLPVRVMEKLANDPESSVVGALHQNPSTPEYIRRELEAQLADSDEYDDDDDEIDDDYGYVDYDHDHDDDDSYLPYHDSGIEYDGKFYDVMELDDYGVTMYFDEDNGWLTELP